MTRLGYRCDDCGEEWRNREPAAVVKDDGNWLDLCASCYDERQEKKEATA